MKFSITPNQGKFIIGVAAYALTVWLIYWLVPAKLCMFAVCVLGFLSFCVALWSLFKPLVTVLVAAALLLAPHQARCQTNDPGDGGNNAVFGCVVIIVGGFVLYGMYKLCQKIPMPGEEPPPPPPCTNCPPFIFPTNRLHQIIRTMPEVRMPEKSLGVGTNWQTFTVSFESSTDGAHWLPEVFLTNWVNGAGEYVGVVADVSGRPLATNYSQFAWMSDTVLVDMDGIWTPPTGDRLRLWRMVDVAKTPGQPQ